MPNGRPQSEKTLDALRAEFAEGKARLDQQRAELARERDELVRERGRLDGARQELAAEWAKLEHVRQTLFAGVPSDALDAGKTAEFEQIKTLRDVASGGGAARTPTLAPGPVSDAAPAHPAATSLWTVLRAQPVGLAWFALAVVLGALLAMVVLHGSSPEKAADDAEVSAPAAPTGPSVVTDANNPAPEPPPQAAPAGAKAADAAAAGSAEIAPSDTAAEEPAPANRAIHRPTPRRPPAKRSEAGGAAADSLFERLAEPAP